MKGTAIVAVCLLIFLKKNIFISVFQALISTLQLLFRQLTRRLPVWLQGSKSTAFFHYQRVLTFWPSDVEAEEVGGNLIYRVTETSLFLQKSCHNLEHPR